MLSTSATLVCVTTVRLFSRGCSQQNAQWIWSCPLR
jgi:hypothetical protein